MLSLNDYGHGADWAFIDNVVDAKFMFGRDRDKPSGVTVTEISGVKVFVASPDSKLVIVGDNASINSSDRIITVWAETLVSGAIQIELMEGDLLSIGTGANEAIYIVDSILNTMWESQYRCFCRRMPNRGRHV